MERLNGRLMRFADAKRMFARYGYHFTEGGKHVILNSPTGQRFPMTLAPNSRKHIAMLYVEKTRKLCGLGHIPQEEFWAN